MQDSEGGGVAAAAVANPAAPDTASQPVDSKTPSEDADVASQEPAMEPDAPDFNESHDSFEVFSRAARGNTVKTADGKQFKIPGSADPLDTLEKKRKKPSGFGSYARSQSLDNLAEDGEEASTGISPDRKSSSHDNILSLDRVSRSSTTDGEIASPGERTTPRLIQTSMTGVRLPDGVGEFDEEAEGNAEPAPAAAAVAPPSAPTSPSSKKKGKKAKKPKKGKQPKNKDSPETKRRGFPFNLFRRTPKAKRKGGDGAEPAASDSAKDKSATPAAEVAAAGTAEEPQAGVAAEAAPASEADAEDTPLPSSDDTTQGFTNRSLGSVSRSNPLFNKDDDENADETPNADGTDGTAVPTVAVAGDATAEGSADGEAQATALFDDAIGQTQRLDTSAALQKSKLSIRKSTTTKRKPSTAHRRSTYAIGDSPRKEAAAGAPGADADGAAAPTGPTPEKGTAAEVTEMEARGTSATADPSTSDTNETAARSGDEAAAPDEAAATHEATKGVANEVIPTAERKRSYTDMPVMRRKPPVMSPGGSKDTRRLSMGIASELNAMLGGLGGGGGGGRGKPNKALLKFANEAKHVRPPSETGELEDGTEDGEASPHRSGHAAGVGGMPMGGMPMGGMAFMSEINAKLGIKKVAKLPVAPPADAADESKAEEAPLPNAEITATLAAKLPPSVLARRGITVPKPDVADKEGVPAKKDGAPGPAEDNAAALAPVVVAEAAKRDGSDSVYPLAGTVAAGAKATEVEAEPEPESLIRNTAVSVRTGNALAFMEAQRRKRNEGVVDDAPEPLELPTSPLLNKSFAEESAEQVANGGDDGGNDDSSGDDDEDDVPESALSALAGALPSSDASLTKKTSKSSQFKKVKKGSNSNLLESPELATVQELEQKAAAESVATQLELETSQIEMDALKAGPLRAKSSKKLSLVMEVDEDED
mmetsp:Transcript_29279/g.76725  ORF Transcript_29279/g.76725 Transcript_29279/m.76725 type:complete len:935 (+) Transcript_29279:63-2867(+)